MVKNGAIVSVGNLKTSKFRMLHLRHVSSARSQANYQEECKIDTLAGSIDPVGEEKLLLQAMIRAAGVYLKLEAGFPAPAARLAAKALPVLGRNRSTLGRYIDPQRMINALHHPCLTPPPVLRSRLS